MVVKIKNLKLNSRVFLAPMLEPNDIAFRLLCKKCGCSLTWTGMTSPLTAGKEIYLDDKPALQLFGNSDKRIGSFVKKYDKKVSLWDFNLGCPSKLSRKLGHGAFMHSDLDTIVKIFEKIRANTKKPVCVKLRKSRNAIKISKTLEEKGLIDVVCIHPRTISQGYSGKADYDFALKFKEGLEVPVIYSGDVDEKNMGRVLKDFDFVMLGRAAIGKPEIFSLGKKCRVSFSDYLTLARRYKLYFRQIKFQAMNFTKGLKGGRKMRAEMIRAREIEDLKNVFKKYK